MMKTEQLIDELSKIMTQVSQRWDYSLSTIQEFVTKKGEPESCK